ncbi:MAG: TIGR04211 family SH3 domain-containing protein [Colwellia sp.]|nr:TIGR04211 family SH3 domain-containing protein [Colwellia sp.]
MKFVKSLFACLVIFNAYSIQAEEAAPQEFAQGFISDELFIYMHSGAGNNYRILGSINSGTEIKLTNEEENEYTQIIDTRGRTVWVESKYVSAKPGLRYIIAELNEKLANIESVGADLDGQLNEANNNTEQLISDKKKLNSEISSLNTELTEVKSQLKDQDMNIKREWFFNGAIVLIIGLVLGLLIPQLTARKKSSMDSWK